jgi:hypothetical protein
MYQITVAYNTAKGLRFSVRAGDKVAVAESRIVAKLATVLEGAGRASVVVINLRNGRQIRYFYTAGALDPRFPPAWD